MPSRDYAVRKSRRSGNKFLLLSLIAFILILAAAGLWFLQSLKQKKPATPPLVVEVEKKSTLPSPPQEIYSYIRDLETREIPVNKDSKFSKLSKEQEEQIRRKQEEEAKRLALPSAPTPPASDDKIGEFIANIEEKPTQAVTKVENSSKKTETTAPKKAEEKNQADSKNSTKTAVTTADASKGTGKYGLQCGAFKNKTQAENMQARLAMAGYNARINSGADWNRVVVGPLGNRAAAVTAQSNAKSVADCVVIGM